MYNDQENFLNLALAGQVMLDEIDDYVDKWHEGSGVEPLHKFLGFTTEEFDLWLQSPDYLAWIITSRRRDVSLETIANDNIAELRMAARADSTVKIKRLNAWLQAKGYK